MIVKDKQATLDAAHNINMKLASTINESIKDFKCEDDPAEYVYLLVQICAYFHESIIRTIEGYASIYGIANVNRKLISKAINEASLEIHNAIRNRMN